MKLQMMKLSWLSMFALSSCLPMMIQLATAAAAAAAASSCNDAPNAQACAAAIDHDTGLACEWCLAGAIPSECMSQEQAKLLPPGVFECSIPSSSSSDSFQHQQPRSFLFDANRILVHVKAKEVEQDTDEDFCDPSSKSISGYVDISGSSYDKDGQDK
jgi:hypothetical protein